jgi:hypothetical protein
LLYRGIIPLTVATRVYGLAQAALLFDAGEFYAKKDPVSVDHRYQLSSELWTVAAYFLLGSTPKTYTKLSIRYSTTPPQLPVLQPSFPR